MKIAYCSVLNTQFLPGFRVMLDSLLRYNTVTEPFIVFTTEPMAQTDLDDLKRKYNNLYFKQVNMQPFVGIKTPDRYRNTLAKFYCLTLSMFDRVIFLDADLLILNDISYLKNVSNNLAACYEHLQNNYEYNSGVMSIGSKYLNKESFQAILKLAHQLNCTNGDQTAFNHFIRPAILDRSYNILKNCHQYHGSWLNNTKILHFIAKKPWQILDEKQHQAGEYEYEIIAKIWRDYHNRYLAQDYGFILGTRYEFHVMLNKVVPNGIGVEVGVQEGAFSSYLLDSWRCQKLYSIDPWLEQKDYADLANISQDDHNTAFQICQKKLKRFGNRSEIIRAFSHEAVRRFADGSLDFVYLDARHDYLSIKEDIELWYRKLKKGGILAGHDYLNGVIANTYFGVKQAVDERFVNIDRSLEIDVLYPSWWITV